MAQSSTIWALGPMVLEPRASAPAPPAPAVIQPRAVPPALVSARRKQEVPVPVQAFYYDPTLTIQARRDINGAQLGAAAPRSWQDWVLGGVLFAVAAVTTTWVVRDLRSES